MSRLLCIFLLVISLVCADSIMVAGQDKKPKEKAKPATIEIKAEDQGRINNLNDRIEKQFLLIRALRAELTNALKDEQDLKNESLQLQNQLKEEYKLGDDYIFDRNQQGIWLYRLRPDKE